MKKIDKQLLDDQSRHRQQVSSHQLTTELSSRLAQSTSVVYELGKYLIFTVVIVLLIHSLLVTIKIISGPSMLPNFISGSHVLLDRRDWLDPERGDVVILKYPGDPENHQYIKRVVAIPGDQIEVNNGQVLINDQPIKETYLPSNLKTFPDLGKKKLGRNEYFTMGDNRPVSNDSRFFGPVERRFIVGRVITTLYTPKG